MNLNSCTATAPALLEDLLKVNGLLYFLLELDCCVILVVWVFKLCIALSTCRTEITCLDAGLRCSYYNVGSWQPPYICLYFIVLIQLFNLCPNRKM